MLKLVTVNLDLNKMGIVNSNFYRHDKKQIVEDIINYNPQRIVYIATLERKDFIENIEKILSKKSDFLKKYNLEDFEIISLDKVKKKYRLLIIQNFPSIVSDIIRTYWNEIFIVPPIVISKENIEFNFLTLSTKRFLKLLKKLEKLGVTYKIKKSVNIYPEKTKIKFTKRQMDVLNLAYSSGYFELPKKIKLSKIASTLNISIPSAQRLIKRIEKKCIDMCKENL